MHELLQAGADELHAFEPHPENVKTLHRRFDTDTRVRIHENAVSDHDGVGELHVSATPTGSHLPFGHTLLKRTDTDEIAWEDRITVSLRSLGSLIDYGELPSRVGILKVDTEGHDLAVVQGMGALEADVVMVEHWSDLPHGLGVCPWSTAEMVETLGMRGFTHYAFIVHRGEFVTLKWDDGDVERGSMGNLIFLHDRILSLLLPRVLDCAGALAEQAVSTGQAYMHVADDRLAVVNELKRASNERLDLVDELKQAANERLDLVNELEQAANERLALVDELTEVAEARGQALDAATARVHALSTELKRRTLPKI